MYNTIDQCKYKVTIFFEIKYIFQTKKPFEIQTTTTSQDELGN